MKVRERRSMSSKEGAFNLASSGLAMPYAFFSGAAAFG